MSTYTFVVISPATTTRPVVISVSQATRPVGSSASTASSTESEIWSATLSGCPSVTDSDVKRNSRAAIRRVRLLDLEKGVEGSRVARAGRPTEERAQRAQVFRRRGRQAAPAQKAHEFVESRQAGRGVVRLENRGELRDHGARPHPERVLVLEQLEDALQRDAERGLERRRRLAQAGADRLAAAEREEREGVRGRLAEQLRAVVAGTKAARALALGGAMEPDPVVFGAERGRDEV